MSHPNHRLPTGVQQRLSSLRARNRRLAITLSAIWGLSALLGLMCVALFLDGQFVVFDQRLRALLTGGCLAVAAWAAWRAARPLLARLGWLSTASIVDQELPAMQERWTTVSQIDESEESSPMSQAMAEQVRREAAAMAPAVDPKQLVDTGRLRLPLAMLAAMVLLTAVFLGSNWQRSQVLLQRFWTPWADASVTRVQAITGNLLVPRGDSLDLVAVVSQPTGELPRGAILMLANAHGEDVVEVLPTRAGRASSERSEETLVAAQRPLDRAEFTYHIPALEGSFRYRWRCGDGQTPWHDVRAVDRPAIDDVELVIEPPPYAQRPIFRKTNLPYRVSAMEGSRLRLRLKPNSNLRRLEIVVRDEQGDEQHRTLIADSDNQYEFAMRLQESVTLRTEMVSREGLSPRHADTCRINVLRDRVPVARFLETEPDAVTVDDVLEIPFEAHDDHGIAKAELMVYEEVNGELQLLDVADIPLDDQRLDRHIQSTAELNLAEYQVTTGSKLSYAIRVTDNRNLTKAAMEKAASQKADRTQAGQSNNAPASDPDMGDNQVGRAAADNSKDGKTVSANAAPDGSPDQSDPTAAQTLAEEADPARIAKSEDAAGPNDEPATVPPYASEDAAGNARTPVLEARPDDIARPASDSDGSADTSAEKKPEGDSPQSSSPQPSRGNKKGTPPPKENAPTPESDVPGNGVLDDTRDGSVTVAETTEADQDDSKSENSNSPPPNRDTDATPPQSPRQPAASEAPRGPTAQPKGPMDDERTNLDQMVGQLVTTDMVRIKIIDDDQRQGDANQKQRKTTTEQLRISDRLQAIHERLEAAKTSLEDIYAAVADDSESILKQSKPLQQTDAELEQAETLIDQLYAKTEDTPLAFAGLQMVSIGQSHIAPARDDLFAVIREPLVSSEQRVSRALNHVAIALEDLEKLTQQVARVQREQKLAEETEELAKMYRVYVKNMQRLLRESRENKHPLKRKMSVSEYTDEYLERYREVLRMRREMMAELGRMLADDPRLRERYTNILRRRQRSLRAQLGDIRERQEELANEIVGWTNVPEDQHEAIWQLVAETRVQRGVTLVRSATQLQDRVATQMPLELKTDEGLPAKLIELTDRIGAMARGSSLKTRRQLATGGRPDETAITVCEEIQLHVTDLIATIETLLADNEGDEAIEDFGERRLAETRQLLLDARIWTDVVTALRDQRFSQLAADDQEGVRLDLQPLLLELTNFEALMPRPLQGDPPAEAMEAGRKLAPLLENASFNQSAAVFLARGNHLKEAARQEMLALEHLQQAEEQFDVLRRAIAAALDELDPRDPNIADLVDPTLDEFLRQLEREPNAIERLGLGNRPRNLQVASDWMLYQLDNPLGSASGAASSNAMERAEQAKQTEEDQQSLKLTSKQAEEDVEAAVRKLRQRAEAPDTDPKEAARLRKLADQLEATMSPDTKEEQLEKWRAMAKADKLRSALKALAQGEELPDNQWNQLLSSLEKGLWQVRGRTPPPEFQDAIDQYQQQMRRLRR